MLFGVFWCLGLVDLDGFKSNWYLLGMKTTTGLSPVCLFSKLFANCSPARYQGFDSGLLVATCSEREQNSWGSAKASLVAMFLFR